MRQLSGWLVWLALGFSVLVPALGLLFGQPLREMILTGLTLAFATIPEELPILITVVLGLGAVRLSRQHAIVKTPAGRRDPGLRLGHRHRQDRHHHREPDGARRVWLPGHGEASRARRGRGQPRRAAGSWSWASWPTTPAARRGAADADRRRLRRRPDRRGAAGGGARRRAWTLAQLRGDGPVVELTFDDRRKLMSAVYRREDGLLLAVKGAPETVLARCDRSHRRRGRAAPGRGGPACGARGGRGRWPSGAARRWRWPTGGSRRDLGERGARRRRPDRARPRLRRPGRARRPAAGRGAGRARRAARRPASGC